MENPKSCTPSKAFCSLCRRILLNILADKKWQHSNALRVEGSYYCWEQIYWHVPHSKVGLFFLFAIVTSAHGIAVLLSLAPPAEVFAEKFLILEIILSNPIQSAQIVRAFQVGYMTGKSRQTGKHSLMVATKLIFLCGLRSLPLSLIQPSPLNHLDWPRSGKETTTSSQPKSGEHEMSENRQFIQLEITALPFRSPMTTLACVNLFGLRQSHIFHPLPLVITL